MGKTFEITFNNYIRDNQFDRLPNHKGIYLFRVSIRKNNYLESTIVYIGKANGDEGIKGRVNENHEHLVDARNIVTSEKEKGNNAFLTICYSDSNKKNEDYLERIEAALIFSRKPLINDKGKDSFNYDETILNISGSHMYDLEDHYIVPTTK